jgi:hypothetical protein
MTHIPALHGIYTRPALSGAEAAGVLTTAHAQDNAALADLFANLGAQIDQEQPRSAAAAELHAALLNKAGETAAWLS